MTMTKTRITQKELARLANVSQSMVSLVLNHSGKQIQEETRERILALAERYNYQANPLARQLRNGQSEFVNIVSSGALSFFIPDLIQLLETELSRRGYRTMLSHLDALRPDCLDAVRSMMAFDFSGTIVLDHFIEPSRRNPWEIAELFNEYDNVIFFIEPPGVAGCTALGVDYGSGVCEAVRHLVLRGCRKIGIALNDMNSLAMTGRLDGYRAGLQQSNLPFLPELCWVAEDHGLTGLAGMVRPQVAEMICRHFYFEQKCDAIIASNDEWEIGIIKALRRSGCRVPEDVAVIGYDNIAILCQCSEPELSSIDMNTQHLAEALIELLMNKVKGKSAAPGRKVKTRLVVRASS